ncbi:hypothetical protein [Endozoicomonas sp. YOMI1]|uniref:hypothetical protein n=1 Tax=Endozoicomonas sp. YOMI1 TaxID=2828739 RepID=UPI0021479F3C|nr:hypothetical protein [Endozoicomonas sp. YOMI1]
MAVTSFQDRQLILLIYGGIDLKRLQLVNQRLLTRLHAIINMHCSGERFAFPGVVVCGAASATDYCIKVAHIFCAAQIHNQVPLYYFLSNYTRSYRVKTVRI